MKIYGSTQYVSVDTEPNQWYSLEVISMWDSNTKVACFDMARGNIISYSLLLNTRKEDENDKSWRFERIENLTHEMKDELIKMGYTIKNNT